MCVGGEKRGRTGGRYSARSLRRPPVCATSTRTTTVVSRPHAGLARQLHGHDDLREPHPVPLQLTAKERSTLAMILGLLVLGVIGMAVLRDDLDPERPQSSGPAPTAARERAPSSRP